MSNIKFSIIIPTYNEADTILNCLESIVTFVPRNLLVEFIIVDGGSSDATLKIVQQFTAFPSNASIVCLKSGKGRAEQMNTGAREAHGTTLVFLHADSLAPRDFFEQLKSFDSQTNMHWGRFDVRLLNPNFAYRIIETFMNHRSAWTNIATGDQGIFVKQAIFKALNGFPNITLMEDIALSKLLKKQSSAYRINSRLQTSSRRWENNGIVKTVVLMWYLRYKYYRGASPDALHKIYYRS